MTATEVVLSLTVVGFGIIVAAFYVQNINLREERDKAQRALRTTEADVEFFCESRDDWREIAEKAISNYHNVISTLYGTEESLRLHEAALKDANATIAKLEGNDETKRLKRLFERLRHFNPSCLHQPGKVTHDADVVTIGLPCCPCVEFIQKEYVDAALGKDA